MKRYGMKLEIITVFIVGLVFNGSLKAATIDIDTGQGNGADAFISSRSIDRDINFGAVDTFFLKNDLGTGFVNRKGYMRFDLSSVDNSISDASLELSFVEDTNPTPAVWSINVFGLSDGNPGENWLEGGITWNNAPANNTTSGSSLLGGQASLLGNFDIDTSTLISGDVVTFSSAELTSFIQNDTDNLLTLILIRPDLTFSNVGFATKEHSIFAPPTLALSAIPLPGAAILFCSSLVALFGYSYRGRKVGFETRGLDKAKST